MVEWVKQPICAESDCLHLNYACSEAERDGENTARNSNLLPACKFQTESRMSNEKF
jgi:hypothetical protein